MKRIGLLLGLAALGGCGHGPPTRFFALDAVGAGQRVQPVRLAPVRLDAVHIPAILDRPEVVTRTAPNRVSVSEQDRWAAPLGEMMRSVLAQDLSTRLAPGSLVFPDAPKPSGTRDLVVDVLALRTDERGAVTLQASWTLLQASSRRPFLTRQVDLRTQTGPDSPEARAAAISALLGQLADNIVAALAAP